MCATNLPTRSGVTVSAVGTPRCARRDRRRTVQLDLLVKALDCEWRTPAELESHLGRVLNAPEWDTLSGQTARASLDAFGVLERDGKGRLRKRPDFVVPSRVDLEEAENRKLREIQELERQHFAALDQQHEEERNVRWEAEKALIVNVIDERLRELGLLSAAPTGAGEGE